MAKTGSYIKLDRGLKNNSLWLLEKPFTKGQAWVDLLILAQGVDKSREYRGKQQMMIHGNVYTSIYFLANRWGWGRTKVYRFLEKLMMDNMITVSGWSVDPDTGDTLHRKKAILSTGQSGDTTNRNKNDTTSDTIITIANWELYQYDDTTNDAKHEPVRRTVRRYYSPDSQEKDTDNVLTEKDKNIPPKSPKGGHSSPKLPRTEEEIDFDRDLGGLPKLDDIPCEADGTKRDIPERVRHLFGYYGAYWRYIERCNTK